MLWQKEDAEDVFQAVFVLLSTKAPKLLKHSSLGGWLHEVAVRTSLKHRGKIARKREVAMLSEMKGKAMEPWKTIASSRDHEMLHREINKLPKRYRDVIVQCHLEGKSREDAALDLGLSMASVKASLARGRKLLRNRLIKQGVAVSAVFTSVAIANNTAQGAACVSESLVHSTLHHCQGLAPDFGVGTGSEVVQSLITKDVSMMTMSLIPTSLVAAAGTVAVCAFSFGAIAQQTSLNNSQAEIGVGVIVSTEMERSPVAYIQESSDEGLKGQKLTEEEKKKEEKKAKALEASKAIEFDALVQAAKNQIRELKKRLGPGHPAIKNVEAKLLRMIEEIMPVAPPAMKDHFQLSLYPQSEKSHSETWAEYVGRLRGSGAMTEEQVKRWKAGETVVVEKGLRVTRIREETAVKHETITKYRDELEGDKKNWVPYTELVKKEFKVQVPYTEPSTVKMTLPVKGTQPDEASFRGFVKPKNIATWDSSGNLIRPNSNRLTIRVGDAVRALMDMNTKIAGKNVGRVVGGNRYTFNAKRGQWCAVDGVEGWIPIELVEKIEEEPVTPAEKK